MIWKFNFGWMLLGLAIATVGILITANYQKICDEWMGRTLTYDRCKLIGIITAAVGFAITANLHTLVLNWIVNLIFTR